ncbi:MAG: MFS transporter [Pseudomonadota bacterium]
MSGRQVKGPWLIAVLCAAQVLGMLSNSTFPALIPTFQPLWGLNNTEAGWISGIYFAGYVVAVPVLVSLTDREDARLIYLASTVLGGLAAIGFAVFAQGLWSALAFRFLGGIGLAGTYMVGLKLLSDRLEGAGQSRAVAIYTSHFGIGVAVSVAAAGWVADLAGWRWAFGSASVGSMAAIFLVLVFVQSVARRPRAPELGHPLDLRPVFTNRRALAFILGYAAHIWELFGMRAWIVAFLVFAFSRQSLDTWGGLTPTDLAAVALLFGMPGSVLGNELAVRFGRRQVISILMVSSALISLCLGFLADLSIGYLVLLVFCYSALLMSDSGALTSGAVAYADPHRRGATMAVHSLFGFGSGFLAPLAFGLVLDLAGGSERLLSWGLAFGLMALSAVVGLVIVQRMGRI